MLTRIAGLLEDLPMRSRSWILAFAIMPFPFVLHAQNTAPHVVKYQATMSTVKYDFGVAEPVARLARATSWTPTPSICFGGAIQKAGDTLALVKGDNPLTGPFYIEGAEVIAKVDKKYLDDHVDNVNDSLAYYIALKNAGVPVEMHFYAQGGHAFGLRSTDLPITQCPKLVETWLSTIGMTPNPP
jgi:hypothetical protein